MKLTYKTRNGRCHFQIDGETIEDIFRSLAQVQDAFEVDEECGCCQSPDIYYRTRSPQGFEYFELACHACGAYLSFGQRKEGGFWPKRTGPNAETAGWRVWAGEEQQSERSDGSPQPQAALKSQPRSSKKEAFAADAPDPRW